MKCPKCRSDVRIILDVTFSIPSEYDGEINKQILRLNEVKLHGAHYERATYYCVNDKCRLLMRHLSDDALHSLDIKELTKDTKDAALRSTVI